MAGAGINGQGGQWSSASAGTYDFDPCVSLSTGTTYLISWFVDTDGDLTDDPEADAANYWAIGTDNENNGDAVQLGRGSWIWDASIPYSIDGTVDAEDDGMFKIYTETDEAEVLYQIRCKEGGNCSGPYKEGETIGPFEVVCSEAPTLSDVTAVTMTLTDGTHTTTVAGTTVASTIVNFEALTVPATWDGPISATTFTLNGTTWTDAGANNFDLTVPTSSNIDDLCANCEVDTVADTQTSWTGVTTDAATFTAATDTIDVLLTLPDAAGYIISAAPTWPRVAVTLKYPATGVYAYYVETVSAQTYKFRIYLGNGYRDSDGITMTGDLLLSDGTFTDQAGNAISITLPTTPNALEDDKTYIVAIPWSADAPLEVATGNTVATMTAAQTIGILAGDHFTLGTVTEPGPLDLSGDDCTESSPCRATLSGTWTQSGAGLTTGDWWVIYCEGNSIIGGVASGDNNTLDKCKFKKE